MKWNHRFSREEHDRDRALARWLRNRQRRERRRTIGEIVFVAMTIAFTVGVYGVMIGAFVRYVVL